MQATIISDTIQEFEGRRYYLCGRYFHNEHFGYLHRKIWEAAHGAIPDGLDVHHVDHDRANNRLDNFQLLSRAAHISLHSSNPTEAQRAARRENVKAAIAGNAKIPACQRSDAGKQSWEKRKHQVETIECQVCGSEFETVFFTRTKFCGPNCRARALRKRRRLERKAKHNGRS